MSTSRSKSKSAGRGSAPPSLPEMVLTVHGPIFEIGAKPGDDILVRPGDEDPISIVRRVRSVRPGYAALAAALSDGRAATCGLELPEALACLIRLASHPTPSSPGRTRGSAPRSQRSRGSRWLRQPSASDG